VNRVNIITFVTKKNKHKITNDGKQRNKFLNVPSHSVVPFVIALHVDCSRYFSSASRRELRSGGGYVCVAKAFVSHFDSWIIREVPFFSSIVERTQSNTEVEQDRGDDYDLQYQ